MQRPGTKFSYDVGRDTLVHQRFLSQIKMEQILETQLVNATFKNLKDIHEQVQKQGIRKSQDDCVSEARLRSNSVLVHGSSTPNQALLGYEPRDFYHQDNKTVSASSDANLSQPDSIESQFRLWLHAKEAIIQA
eukprot:4250321-Pyramimonas_sp.AAC.1